MVLSKSRSHDELSDDSTQSDPDLSSNVSSIPADTVIDIDTSINGEAKVEEAEEDITSFGHAHFVFVMYMLYPVICLMALLRALWQRIVKGRASQILDGSLTPAYGSYQAKYCAQAVFRKAFKPEQLQTAFLSMLKDAGLCEHDGSLHFQQEIPRHFPVSCQVDATHYVDTAVLGKAGVVEDEGDHIVTVHVWNGTWDNHSQSMSPTVLHFYLPGDVWDGTSCFNFIKELIARYYGDAPQDVFRRSDLRLIPESAEQVNRHYPFWCFLFSLPWIVLVQLRSAILSNKKQLGKNLSLRYWYVVATRGYYPSKTFSREVTFLNFSEEESTKLMKGCARYQWIDPDIMEADVAKNSANPSPAKAENMGISPFAALAHAGVAGYRSIFGRNPPTLCTFVSVQRNHYKPVVAERNLVGDWLLVPRQVLPSLFSYTCQDAQRRYEELLHEVESLTGSVARAFAAKAYGWKNSGIFFGPLHPDDVHASDALVFNNYGKRTVHPDSELVSFNWPNPRKIGMNCIYVNGKTCITLSSNVADAEMLRWARDRVEKELREVMAWADE